MTYKEIAAVFKRDFEEEIRSGYNHCFGMEDKLSRMVRKLNSNEFHLLYTHHKKTKQLNDYTILFFSREKPRKGLVKLRRTVYLKYMRSDGIHIATAHPNFIDEVSFYTPHFFDRYRERMLKKPEMQKLDVIDYFMAKTAATTIQDVHNPKYPNSVFATNEEGVLLGENLGDGLFEFRTFITVDMLGQDQWIRSLGEAFQNVRMKEDIESFHDIIENLAYQIKLGNIQ